MHDLDHTQRFLFDDNDVRGEMVSLAESYQHVLAKHPYPQPVAQLLGEMLAAAALLVGTLKFEGLLILQARSSGPVPLVMIECSSEREVRGIAFTEFQKEDVVRHPLVARIVSAYEVHTAALEAKLNDK